MVGEYHHGITIIKEDLDPRPMDAAKMTSIGLIGTAGAGVDNSVWPMDEPIHIFSNEYAKIAKLGVGGTLKDHFDGIDDQGIIASVVAIRVEEAPTVEGTLSKIIGSSASRTGVHGFYDADAELGVVPNILVAPGFTSQRPGDAANPVVAEMLGLADKMMSVIVADGPDTTRDAAVEYRRDWESDRLIIVDPHVKVWREGDLAPIIQPASARIAGLGVKRDKEKGGPFWSWSNQQVGGIVGTARPISYYINDPDSEQNFLNSHQIASIHRETGEMSGGNGGHLFWGNESATSDTLWRFYNVRRGRDFIHKTVLKSFKTYLGRYNIGARLVEVIFESLDRFVMDLKADNKIIDGKVYLDADLNSPAQLRLGKLRIEVAVEEPAPLQNLIIGSRRLEIAYEGMIEDILKEIGTTGQLVG